MSRPDEQDELGFEADFVFADDDSLLSIKNDGRVNRDLLTQDRLGKTGYSAYIRHIQYATYQGKPACLLGVDIDFRFPTRALSRFTSAEVEVTFEKALDVSKPLLRSSDASLDPVVANFAPKTILGQARERENKKTYEVEAPVVFNAAFGSAELKAKWSRETTMTEEGRLEVHGNLAQDDDHDEGANSVTWDLTENPISKEGILRSFRAVIVLLCRPKEAFWMHTRVKPVVKFSLDPRRLFTKKLVAKRDQPILLDGKTIRGEPNILAHEKLDADDFPWEAVLQLPANLGGGRSTGETTGSEA